MGRRSGLTWRHFFSGLIAFTAVTTFWLVVLAVNNPSAQVDGQSALRAVQTYLLVLVIALPIGWFIEGVLVPRTRARESLFWAVGLYFVVGVAIDLALIAVSLLQMDWSSMSTGNPLLGQFILGSAIIIYYSAIALPTRALYPLAHRLVWRKQSHAAPAPAPAEGATEYQTEI